MAHGTGTATDFDDLMSKLFSFATANGWSQDYTSTEEADGKYAISKNDIYASWRRVDPVGSYISLHQALAFDGVGTDPGSHTDDSGNGYNGGTINDTNLRGGRFVEIGNGSFPSYHFFENDSGPTYLHIVVETSAGIFSHWGFGELEKKGAWTGGEYCYGHSRGITVDAPLGGEHSILLDGVFASSSSFWDRGATIHLEGLPSQPGASKWGQIWRKVSGSVVGTPPLDTAGNAKVHVLGGFRGGPVAEGFGWLESDAVNGNFPAYPIWLFYIEGFPTGATFEIPTYALGCMPDVRGCSIDANSPGDEITIGSDTWVIFPSMSKNLSGTANNSANQGIIYKKVTA